MKLRIPSYYQQFTCIADKCKDSCCIGWEIDIDEDTYDYYKGVKGSFGERLEKNMVTEEEIHHFTLKENGWCPFLNQQKLCDICLELGEEALSEVCTEYPRFTVEYEDVREKALCLSCEEVGRILFWEKEKVKLLEFEIPDEAEEFVTDINQEAGMESDIDADTDTYIYARNLEKARAIAIGLLQDRQKSIRQRAVEYLIFCETIQEKIVDESLLQQEYDENTLKKGMKDKEEAYKEKEGIANFCMKPSYEAFALRMKLLEELEVLDEEWITEKKRLKTFFSKENYVENLHTFLEKMQEREVEYEQLLVYYTFRYFMNAYYDYQILTKAQFAVISYLSIRDMGVERYFSKEHKEEAVFSIEDQIDVARIYAKEVEHSEENMELMMEAFEFDRNFQMKKMIKEI